MVKSLSELPKFASLGRCSIHSLSLKDQSLDDESPHTAESKRGSKEEEPIIKPTLKRYIILFLFCLNSGNKAFQWIQIPAGTKKISYFYDVDNFVINGIAAIFLVSFIFLSWPACFIIERMGMRRAVLIASFGTAVGSIIKSFSCYEGGIVPLYFAQILVSMSEQLIFSVPARLASVWFPDDQVSLAMGLSILGNQLGVAIGFVIPQVLLDGAETKEEIKNAVQLMFYGTVALSVFAFVANFLLFDEAPKYAPGSARLKQIREEEEVARAGRQSIWSDVCQLGRKLGHLMKDREIVLLTLSYGVGIGVNNTITTLLNQMLEPLWPGNDLVIGNAGFCIIIFGALGSAFWGRLLDVTHKYWAVNTFLTAATISSIIFFGWAVSFTSSEWAIYIGSTMIGVFQIGFMVAGMELAVELSYPAPELVTASLMNVSPQLFSTFFVFMGSYIVDNYGALATNVFYLILLAVSLILLLCVKENLKRQRAVAEKEAAHLESKKISVSCKSNNDTSSNIVAVKI